MSKKFDNLKTAEQLNLAARFEVWLGRYTQEVINKVIARLDEILENEFAMKLINELYEREEKERAARTSSLRLLMIDYDLFKDSDIHSNCLTHSNSYRDVLYDMYIKDAK